MRQPGAPPLRVRIALVAACYLFVWLGGVALHGAPCTDTPQPHCTLCACLTTVPLIVHQPAATPVLRDAGAVALFVPLRSSLAAADDGVTRAPPAAGTVTSC